MGFLLASHCSACHRVRWFCDRFLPCGRWLVASCLRGSHMSRASPLAIPATPCAVFDASCIGSAHRPQCVVEIQMRVVVRRGGRVRRGQEGERSSVHRNCCDHGPWKATPELLWLTLSPAQRVGPAQVVATTAEATESRLLAWRFRPIPACAPSMTQPAMMWACAGQAGGGPPRESPQTASRQRMQL